MAGKQIQAVHLRNGSGPVTISTQHFINAAGPLLKEVGLMIGVDLPVFSELHLKMAFKDTLRSGSKERTHADLDRPPGH